MDQSFSTNCNGENPALNIEKIHAELNSTTRKN